MRLSFLAGLVAGLMTSCGSGDLSVIEVDVDIERQTVPGALPVSSCSEISEVVLGPEDAIVPFSASFSDEEELEGVPLDLLEEVVLDRVVLQIVDEAEGDDDDFDFVDAIRIFLSEPDEPGSEVLVAELEPVPRDADRITIPGTGVDVRDIASRDRFVISGEAEGRLPCDEVHFVGEAEFDVTLF